jgi:hypothetical protein
MTRRESRGHFFGVLGATKNHFAEVVLPKRVEQVLARAIAASV